MPNIAKVGLLTEATGTGAATRRLDASLALRTSAERARSGLVLTRFTLVFAAGRAFDFALLVFAAIGSSKVKVSVRGGNARYRPTGTRPGRGMGSRDLTYSPQLLESHAVDGAEDSGHHRPPQSPPLSTAKVKLGGPPHRNGNTTILIDLKTCPAEEATLGARLDHPNAVAYLKRAIPPGRELPKAKAPKN